MICISEVGQGQSLGKFFLVGRSDRGKVRGSFFWSNGRTVAKSGEVFFGWMVGRSDGRTDGSFYFALETPSIYHDCHLQGYKRVAKFSGKNTKRAEV